MGAAAGDGARDPLLPRPGIRVRSPGLAHSRHRARDIGNRFRPFPVFSEFPGSSRQDVAEAGGPAPIGNFVTVGERLSGMDTRAAGEKGPSQDPPEGMPP
jgi:hypothetical protein